MGNDSRVDEYLQRIAVNRPSHGSNEDYLAQLHIGHLTHIPFETFDLIDLKQLNIEQDYIFDRLVRQQRGGVCYQLNGLFAFILEKLNYKVQMIPCAVYRPAMNDFYDTDRHVTLCVTVDDGTRFLCDVGFSKECLTPLLFRSDCVQFTVNGFARLKKTDDGLYYQLERGFLKENEHLSLPSPSSLRTSVVDIDPERIQWQISYRFAVDFADKPIKLEDCQDHCWDILHAPDVTLNRYTLCNLHRCSPAVGFHAIRGKEYCESVIKDGREVRHCVPLTIEGDALNQFLKEKFNVSIERKIELVD